MQNSNACSLGSDIHNRKEPSDQQIRMAKNLDELESFLFDGTRIDD